MAYPLDNNKEIPLIQLPTGTPDAGDFVMYTTSDGQTKIATFDQFQDGLVADLTDLVAQAEAAAAAAGDKMPSLTLSQLQALNIEPEYEGVYMSEPGREGTFIKDNSTGLSVDGAIVIQDAAGNKWVRRYEGPIEVKWFGAKGDGVTDDTAAVQAALNRMNSGLFFNPGKYLISSVTVPNKPYFAITGPEATIKGSTGPTAIFNIGSANVDDPMYKFNGKVFNLNFELPTASTTSAIGLSNARNLELSGLNFKGGNACAYVRGFNLKSNSTAKGIHTTTVQITGCSVDLDETVPNVTLRGTNYFLYIDSTTKTSPYTGIVFQAADFTLANNNCVHSNISNVVCYGIDGIKIMTNRFFLSGGFYKSQIKERNIHLVNVTWTSILGNELFEAGYEGILIESAAKYTVSGNTIAWPGQRDCTKGYGIRVANGGLPANPTYGNFTINGNVVDLPTRSGILLDTGTNYATAYGNEVVSPGNPSHYYGTGEYDMGDNRNIPLLSSVTNYNMEWAATNLGCLVFGNHGNESSYNFPVSESVDIYKRSRHFNNIGLTGIFGDGSTIITSITANTVASPNQTVLYFNVSGGGTVGAINEVNLGERRILYNDSGNITLTNSATMRLAGGVDAVIPFRGTLTLIKQVDGFKEVSRSFEFASTPLADAKNRFITPFVATDLNAIANNFELYRSIGAANSPATGASGFQFSSNNDTNRIQVAFTASPAAWVRASAGSSWGSWLRLASQPTYSTKATGNMLPGFINEVIECNNSNTVLTLVADATTVLGTRKEFKNNSATNLEIAVGSGVTINGGTTSILIPTGKLALFVAAGANTWRHIFTYA